MIKKDNLLAFFKYFSTLGLLLVFMSFAPNTFGQTNSKTITGTITGQNDGLPLIGATVVEKGTSNGTTTDFDGKYELTVTENSTLVYSYIGMKPQEVQISGQSVIDIIMEDDVFGIEEVVISGVASATPRKILSISVEKVDAAVMKEVHASSAVNALQGKVAGLKITSAGGSPGSSVAIRLRGSTSLIGKNEPLIILDGNRVSSTLADINLDDIESFEVVKGAAASALYGSEAENGVVVLISKRGKTLPPGKSTVTIRSEYGYEKIADYLPVATHHPYQLADDYEDYDYTRYKGVFYYEGVPISGSRLVTESGYADQPYDTIYNHQALFFKKGSYHTEYIGITGKGDKSNYLLSFENNKQEGIVNYVGGYHRNNIKFNMDRNVGDKITISTSNILIQSTSQQPSSTGTFQDLLFLSPDVNLLAKNSDSTDFLIRPDVWKKSLVENPLYPLANLDILNKRRTAIGNVKINYFVTDWLKAEAKYAFEYKNRLWNTITPRGYLGNNENYIGGKLYKKAYSRLGQDLSFTLHINKQIKDFTNRVKLSYLYERADWDIFSASAKNFFAAGIPHFNNTDPTTAKLSSAEGRTATIDYFGIYDLDYKSKYIFSTLLRMDGSSLFGPEVRWNPYFRLSGAYRITEDIKIPKVDELKVRVAYGSSGARPPFGSIYEIYRVKDGHTDKLTSEANRFLKPSTTYELEVGMNLGFLKHFSLEVLYASGKTTNVFNLAPQPSHIGAPFKFSNIGIITFNSWEASLRSVLVNTQDISWHVNTTFDRIRQKVESLNIPSYSTGPSKAFLVSPGESFGVIYGTSWLTSLEDMANQLPEDKTIDDYEINSDGYVIPKGTEGTKEEIPIAFDADNDGNPDKVTIGNTNADFNMSLQNSFALKGFNLSFLLSWKKGGDVYNFTRQYGFRDYSAKEIDQYGKPDNEKKTINYYGTLYNGTGINSHFVEDGSFVKLREVSLSYTFDKQRFELLGKFAKSIRIGFQVRNALTFTKYTGYDPEVASGRDLTVFSYDNFGYPNFRTYTGSVKIIF